MALTAGNVTIKLAGGTYPTWEAFWNDLGNLTGNITCTVDASAITEAAAPAAVDESLNGHIIHVLPASFPTKTDASDGARFTCNYVQPVLELQMEGAGTVIIEGMVFIEGTSEPSRILAINTIDAEFNFVYRRNTLKGGTYGILHGDGTMNAGTKIYNNIIYDASLDGISIALNIGDAVIANNTIVNCVNNVNCGALTVTFENNLSYGGSTMDFKFPNFANGYNNADSDSTGEDADWGDGSGNVPGIDDPFNNLGADDFTITAEGVIGRAGLDLSTDFEDDFFGVTRSNWTIGACEFISPPTNVPVAIHHYKQAGGL